MQTIEAGSGGSDATTTSSLQSTSGKRYVGFDMLIKVGSGVNRTRANDSTALSIG